MTTRNMQMKEKENQMENSRQIKFRAWDSENGMVNVQTLFWNQDGELQMPYFTLNGGVLMQYTGLKDKNGVEIYEGDIVDYYKEEKKWEIRLCPYSGITLNRNNYQKGEDNCNDDPFFIEFDRVEIIGNIYQNPELIK